MAYRIKFLMLQVLYNFYFKQGFWKVNSYVIFLSCFSRIGSVSWFTYFFQLKWFRVGMEWHIPCIKWGLALIYLSVLGVLFAWPRLPLHNNTTLVVNFKWRISGRVISASLFKTYLGNGQLKIIWQSKDRLTWQTRDKQRLPNAEVNFKREIYFFIYFQTLC